MKKRTRDLLTVKEMAECLERIPFYAGIWKTLNTLVRKRKITAKERNSDIRKEYFAECV